jgi:RHS repeat-associated protein
LSRRWNPPKEREYDADSNVLSRQTRAGATISFTYDTLNRLSTKAAPSEPTVTYSYDLAGHPLGFSDNSAAMVAPSTVGTVATLTSSYDSLNSLTGSVWGPVTPQTAPSASGVTFTYLYDATNRRISQTVTDNSYWSYPAPTASTVSYTANNLDQYTAIGSVTPTYDSNGNLTFDGTFTYGYDAENRLISASGGGNTAAYAYDAQGRRKSKTVNGTTTIFVQDPQGRALLDYDGASGTIQNWYAFGSGPNDVLNQINIADSTRATTIPDIQGSIVASLDASSGALTKAGYQSYGESNVTSGTFRYTGARIDAETNGLYDFRARMYSPTLGRFMQVDPIGAAGGINLYAYVGNDPLNLIDPYGWVADSPFAANIPQPNPAPGAASAPNSSSPAGDFAAPQPIPNATSSASDLQLVAGEKQLLPFESGGAFQGPGGVIAAPGTSNFFGLPSSPSTLARVIPNGIPATTLGPPGAADVFVTTPEAIAGLDSAGIAQRLTIPQSPSGFKIMQFPTPETGLASPVFRTNPGFVGNGYTAGGAPEFVIPNGPIPPGTTITTVP